MFYRNSKNFNQSHTEIGLNEALQDINYILN